MTSSIIEAEPVVRHRGAAPQRRGPVEAAASLRPAGREAALLQQRFHLRIATAELAVRLRAIARVAGRQDELAHAARERGVEDVAGLEEGVPGVRVHYLRPEIT